MQAFARLDVVLARAAEPCNCKNAGNERPPTPAVTANILRRENRLWMLPVCLDGVDIGFERDSYPVQIVVS